MSYFADQDIDTRTCGQADEDAMLDRRDGLASAWQAMNKRQRMAFIKQGGALTTTSSQRRTAVATLKKNAGGS